MSEQNDNHHAEVADDDIGVKRTSQLLLSGWTMLADHCPRTTCHYPLMENKRTGVVQCPKCQDRFARDHGELVLVSQLESQSTTTTSSSSSSSSTPIVRPASKSASSIMGQLLLKGWTMLQDSCPVCGTPLMRHPTNRDECFCATCNATVVDQTKQSQQMQQTQQTQQSQTSSDSVSVASAAPPPPTRVAPSSLRDTLNGKLAVLHDAIRDVDPVRDVARFNELCVSIQRCGNALNAVAGSSGQ